MVLTLLGLSDSLLEGLERLDFGNRESLEEREEGESYEDYTIDHVGHGIVGSREGKGGQVRAVWQDTHPYWCMEVIGIERVRGDIPVIPPSKSIFDHQQKTT